MTEETIFQEALAQSAADRARFLDKACAGQPQLRAAVEALLAAHQMPDNVLDEPPGHFAATMDSEPAGAVSAGTGEQTANPIGSRSADALLTMTTDYRRDAVAGVVIGGRYTLQERIGEGGMGEVWVAKQTEPVKRKVALKLIKTGMDSRAVVQRFEQERQALALMDHPHIARVLDGGITPTGQPFFVMELVNGLPLIKFCDETKLTLKSRLELFVPICQAVQHAHQKGIVHRDLKPANILVTMIDGKPVPKVIDFGVAKATSGKLTEETMSTGFGAVVGTLEYMSPEQAGFSGEDIDTRADIYSLGVILYELLTGLRPIDAKRLRKAALTEMIRMIQKEVPSKPSTRLSTNESLPSIAAIRQTEPNRLMALLRGELDWVVMKCLEKQRDRRYETANALARDVQRYLTDEVVEARPPSARYRLHKFVRRNPLQLALAGTILLLLLGSAYAVWWQSQVTGARRVAELRRQLEDEQRAAADNARYARNAEAVASLLGQAEEWLKAGDTAKAAVVLEAAKKRSAEGGAEKDDVLLKRLDEGLALVRDLDDVDQFRWTWSENKFPSPAVVAMRTREALRRIGVDPDTVPADGVAARISSSVVPERILSALDRLLLPIRLVDVDQLPVDRKKLYPPQLMADVAAQLPTIPRVHAVLRLADPDPYRDAVRDAILAGDRTKLVELAGQEAAALQPPTFTAFMGECQAIPVDRRRKLLQAALIQRPGDLGLLMALGSSYLGNEMDLVDERLRWFQAAIAAAPSNYGAHNNLGTALQDKGELDQAIACFRKAIKLGPMLAAAHTNLGNAMAENGEVDQAIACFQNAVALDPMLAPAHSNLGVVMADNGDVDQAIACFRKAIELDPKFAAAHNGLGATLCDVKRDYDGAIVCFRKSIELDPLDGRAHFNLANALVAKGQVVEAIDNFRRAIDLDPKFATAHNSLGAALAGIDQLDEAIVCFRKAIEVDPTFAMAHSSLGAGLARKGQLDEAILSFRKAIELNPTAASSHANLGAALTSKGDLEEGIASFRRANELDPKFVSARNGLARAERLVAAQEQLPALLSGDFNPTSNSERLVLAELCKLKKLHRAAAGLYADAIAADPLAAADLRTLLRYKAACSAALAAEGLGEDSARTDDAERTRLRKQAIDWLQADLTGLGILLDSGPPQARPFIVQALSHWQKNADLASIRDEAMLAKLPLDEPQAFIQLWTDVVALLKTAEEQPK